MNKAKLNKKDFIFEKKKNEVLTKVPGQLNGLDFLISNLEGCEVYIMDHTAQIYVDDCKNCTLYIGPVEASLFIRDCENLKVSGACNQYRVSDSRNIDSCMYSHTDPTLENCRNIRFAPYNFAYPLQGEHFQKANLDPRVNRWSQVFDFNENRQDPNWSILPPSEFPGPIEKPVEGMSDPENPAEIPKQYGGTLEGPILVGSQEAGASQDNQGMMEFGIHTGAEHAQNYFEGGQGEDQGHEQEWEQEHHEEHIHAQGQTQGSGGNEYDDFFGSQTKPQGDTKAQFGTGSPQKFGTGSPQKYGTGSPEKFGTGSPEKYGTTQGMGQGIDMFGGDYDPEEEERQERLRGLEHQRIQALEDKARIEREKKQEKISNAARELAKWHSEREQNIEKRKQINRQNQQIQEDAHDEEDYKNPWEKIVANIAVKEGEYPGTKDVTRFKQSLLNKKGDAAKGVNTKLGEY